MAETMMTYFLAACLVIIPVMSAPASHASDDICHGLDCPKYTLLNKTTNWELRRYDVVTWVATNVTAMSRDDVGSQMFQLLFKYISGENSQKVKIDMTAPVLTQVIHGQGPNCESDFVMHFMVPFSQWTSPIQPTNAKVSIVQSKQMDVFVKSFGGFPKDQEYLANVQELAQSLPSDVNVDDKFFFIAGYDGPYQYQNRHNEVWLQKV